MSSAFRSRVRRIGPAGTIVLVLFGMVACEREKRPFRDLPVASSRAQTESQSQLYAGEPLAPAGTQSPFRDNAWGIGEGKRLFISYNCSGCHANGGGGIGPALMDDEWIYGSQPFNIYSTILEGRPNGMPSFRSRVADQQVWQLVAYVQSMSGQAPIDAAPGRADHMQARTPENATPAQTPVQTGHR
jgi:cytochrome c oxidase cbb3-type subunit 3